MTDEAFESRLERLEAIVETLSKRLSSLERGVNGAIELIGSNAGQINELKERLDAEESS